MLKKKIKHIFMFLLILTAMSFSFPIFASACSIDSYMKSKLTQADAYTNTTKKSGAKALSCEYKSTACSNRGYKYAIKMLSNAGDVVYVCSDVQFTVSNVDINVAGGGTEVTGINSNNALSWNAIFEKYKNIIVFASGVGCLSCLLAFILMFLKLGASASNPKERKEAAKGVIYTGIGTAALGCVTIIMGFFYNMF